MHQTQHGTVSGYRHGPCRCEACADAYRDYHRGYQRRRRAAVAGRPPGGPDGALGELLHELFPHGLTDDCPDAISRRASTLETSHAPQAVPSR